MNRGPIVVTGATGFIGRHVVETLAAEGRPVRAVTRRGAVFPAGVEVSTVKDLGDREALGRGPWRHGAGNVPPVGIGEAPADGHEPVEF